MNNYFVEQYHPDYIMHYGIKGMKWGVRRSKYYMDDGSLTRYGKLRSQKRSMSPDRYKKLKKKYKQDIKDQWKKLNKDTRLGNKLLYGQGTLKRQAEYMVNRKMSSADAAKKAKKDAWRNAAIYVGLNAALAGAGSRVLNRQFKKQATAQKERNDYILNLARNAKYGETRRVSNSLEQLDKIKRRGGGRLVSDQIRFIKKYGNK